MRRFILLLCPVFFLTLSSLHQIKGEVPLSVKQVAIKMTDKQIDSVYKHSNIPPLIDALRYDFRELRSHMDSLNAENIVLQQQFHEELVANDSITHVLLRVSLQNDSLRSQIREKDEQISFIKRAPDYLMGFVMIIAGTLVALGMFNKYQEYKQDANRQNHV